MKRTIGIMAVLVIAWGLLGAAAGRTEEIKGPPKPHPSELAALRCIEKFSPVFTTHSRQGEDIECNIPVELSEKDLDTVLAEAIKAAAKNPKWRSYAKKYGGAIAKAVTNFRAASCHIRIKARRNDIVDALEKDHYVMQMDDQPVTCNVLTRNRDHQPLSFTFTPRIETGNGCIRKFALNMGKIDAGCKICFINRLYITTRLVALWANHLAGNVRHELNRSLGASCREERAGGAE